FGPAFVELYAQCIANAAAFAEERGYQVTRDEIRSDLFQNIYNGYRRLTRSDSAASSQDLQEYFQRKMLQFGFEENTMLEAWRKVMLFRRLFADVGGSVLIDSLPYQQFQQFSRHHAKLELY